MALNINQTTDKVTPTTGTMDVVGAFTVNGSPVGGGGTAPTYAVLASDQATTTSYTNLTGFSFTAQAGKTYEVTFTGIFTGSTTNGAPFLALTVPGTSTVIGSGTFQSNSVSPSGVASFVAQEASGVVVNSSSTIRAFDTNLPVLYHWVVTADGTGGTVQLTAAVRTGTGAIKAGSVFSYVKVN